MTPDDYSKAPKHSYWGAGEKDCPTEIKAANGELHTMRCKLCGLDNPRIPVCAGGKPVLSRDERRKSLAIVMREAYAKHDGRPTLKPWRFASDTNREAWLVCAEAALKELGL